MSLLGDTSEFDAPPKFLRGNAPNYPIRKARRGESGYAVVDFTVDESGRTRDIKVETANDPSFANQAVVAIQRWLFQPAMKKGRPVSCRIQTPIYYRMRI